MSIHVKDDDDVVEVTEPVKEPEERSPIIQVSLSSMDVFIINWFAITDVHLNRQEGNC